MDNTLHFTLGEIINDLDGFGLVITDADLLAETLESVGLSESTDVTSNIPA